MNLIPTKDFLYNRSFAVWDCYSDADSTYNGKLHFHEFYELTLVYEGRSSYNVNGQNFLMERGCIQLTTPSDYHIGTSGEGEYIRYINVIFAESVISKEVSDALYRFPSLYIKWSGGEFDAVLSELRSAADDYLSLENSIGQSFGAEKLIANIIENVCIKLVRKLKSETNLADRPRDVENGAVGIRAALLYIRNNYRRPITLEDAARAAEMSRGYFCTKFKETLGVGFSDYLLNYRLSISAMEISADNGERLKEIAYGAGFKTFSYFSAAFKSKYGVSPRDYSSQL